MQRVGVRKEWYMFMLVVLPRFDLCRSKSFHERRDWKNKNSS